MAEKVLESVSSKPQAEFRKFMPDLNQPRFQDMAKQDAHTYAQAFLESHNPPWLYGLYEHWRSLFQEPYKGVTNDGKSVNGLVVAVTSRRRS